MITLKPDWAFLCRILFLLLGLMCVHFKLREHGRGRDLGPAAAVDVGLYFGHTHCMYIHSHKHRHKQLQPQTHTHTHTLHTHKPCCPHPHPSVALTRGMTGAFLRTCSGSAALTSGHWVRGEWAGVGVCVERASVRTNWGGLGVVTLPSD